MKFVTASLLTLFLFTACSSENIVTQSPDTWTPTTKGPWDGEIHMATSSDGLTFDEKGLILERAGVPNLLKLQNNDLILTYQYFSDSSEAMFGIIAYSVSKDNGTTWSEPKAINFENLPDPLDSAKVPMDPTLVQLKDGRLRLYFTYHAKGNQRAALYSTTTADANIDSTFVANKTPALILSPEATLLDPAVTFFDGAWHHYTCQADSDNNYHSISTDGLTFTLQDDISLPMDFLGQVIPFKDGLRFYGTGNGVTSAFSSDGFIWEIDGVNIVEGADPAVQQLNDGSFVMIYTPMNFN